MAGISQSVTFGYFRPRAAAGLFTSIARADNPSRRDNSPLRGLRAQIKRSHPHTCKRSGRGAAIVIGARATAAKLRTAHSATPTPPRRATTSAVPIRGWCSRCPNARHALAISPPNVAAAKAAVAALRLRPKPANAMRPAAPRWPLFELLRADTCARCTWKHVRSTTSRRVARMFSRISRHRVQKIQPIDDPAGGFSARVLRELGSGSRGVTISSMLSMRLSCALLKF